VEEDVLIQRGLALFFAGKLRCAVLWRIFTITGNHLAGDSAITRYTEGRNAWAIMAERAKSVYQPNITYGVNTLKGHWLDRIQSFDEDISDMLKRIETFTPAENKIDPAAAERALKIANARSVRPSVSAVHTPENRYLSGKPVMISIRIKSRTPRRVMLHYRHVNQAERWQSVELTRNNDTFLGEIPATYTTRRYALQYYFEVETGPAEATLIPQFTANLDNVPYYIVRRDT
jgi:hypothetical protein